MGGDERVRSDSTAKKVLTWATAAVVILGLFGASNFTELFIPKAIAQKIKKIEPLEQAVLDGVKTREVMQNNAKGVQTQIELLSALVGQNAGRDVMSQQMQVMSNRVTELTKENVQQRERIKGLELELQQCRDGDSG